MTYQDIEVKMKQSMSAIAQSERQLTQLSRLRLLTFTVAALAFLIYFRNDHIGGLVVGCLGTLSFLLYVRQFQRIQKQEAMWSSTHAVLERYKQRLDDQWHDLPEDGVAFQEGESALSEDLDLFGPGSLFQYLSVTHTQSGHEALARLLTHPDLRFIKERQASVRELLADDDWAVAFEALAYQPNSRKRERERQAESLLRNYIEDHDDFLAEQARRIGAILPPLTLVSGVAAYFGYVPVGLPLFAVAVQLSLAIGLAGKIGEEKERVIYFARRFEGFAKRLALLEERTYESGYLMEMRKDIASSARAMNTLAKVIQFWQWRDNMILYLPLCGIFAWDFHAITALDQWRRSFGESFLLWLDWIGEVEALLSLGTIGRVRDTASFPEIYNSQDPLLYMEEGTHPLLPAAKAVANDYRQDGETVIITGSNMSGKSTFMRTLGLNAILAYAGGTVCAKRFVISPMEIFTSMRVKDNVSQGISTFYGEILRVKAMAEQAKKKRPTLILIDEIFKGTNSADRIIGAEAAIEKLSRPWLMTLVTTHDFELCALVENEAIHGRNAHFQETYQGDTIEFDYKIRSGRCRTTNAKALMRMAGLLDEKEGD